MRLAFLVVSCASILLVAGCVPVILVGGAAAGATVVATRDAPIEQQVRDGMLWVSIYRAFRNSGIENLSAVDVSVTFGRVTLSGHVASLEEKFMAAKLAGRVPGVVSIANEIRVLNLGPRGGSAVQSFALAARVRSEVIFTIGLRASNYKIDADLGVVTISGTALNLDERDRVMRAVRSVRGVRRVNSHILVIGADPARGALYLVDHVRSAILYAVGANAASHYRIEASSSGLITIYGTAPNFEERMVVVRAAAGVPGVLGVNSNITVLSDRNPNTNESDLVGPNVIVVRARAMISSILGETRASGYTITLSSDKVLSVHGTAGSISERHRIIMALTSITGVKRVDSHIRIAG